MGTSNIRPLRPGENHSIAAALTWRPAQIASAEQVHVHVKYRLSRPGADVEHCTVAVFNFSISRDLCRREVATPNGLGFVFSRFLQTANVFLRNNQNMRGRFRIDV